MTTVMTLLPALVAGLGLGLIFFGGLWLTVRQLADAQHPWLLFAVSFVLRLALVIAGMYLVMDGSWQRMLACLAGFIIVRQIILSRLQPDRLPEAHREEGAEP